MSILFFIMCWLTGAMFTEGAICMLASMDEKNTSALLKRRWAVLFNWPGMLGAMFIYAIYSKED